MIAASVRENIHDTDIREFMLKRLMGKTGEPMESLPIMRLTLVIVVYLYSGLTMAHDTTALTNQLELHALTPPANSAEPAKEAVEHLPQIIRQIPEHDITLLNGCDIIDIEKNYYTIRDAISVGAPVFNRGEHATCYVIYERTASDLESNPKTCRGVRKALDAGLHRAESLPTYSEKAWAMRDTFDGLLKVIARKSDKIK